MTGPGGVTLCSPSTTSCTSPNANVGTITYTPVTASVVTINNTTSPTNPNPVTGTTTSSTPNPNGIATANLPGSTIINATTSEVTSAAGYFSTCPPASIDLTINGSSSATVTPSSPQTVVATAMDSNTPPAAITGLTLTYSSTEPQNLSVSSTGLVTATFPSHATVTAMCEPPSCNPAPVNLIGTLGNGMPVTGEHVTINSPGRSSNQIWMASSQSPYFSEVDLTTGGAAAPVRLPYTPNSMVMDQGGDTLYFGSYHELMTSAPCNNALSKEVTSVPGVVLAVSPTGTTVVMNDQLRQVIYLYSVSAGTLYQHRRNREPRRSIRPMGPRFTSPGQDPATGQNTLFVNNASTGWSSYPLTNQPAYSCPLEAGRHDHGARLQPGVGSLLRAVAGHYRAQRGDLPQRQLAPRRAASARTPTPRPPLLSAGRRCGGDHDAADGDRGRHSHSGRGHDRPSPTFCSGRAGESPGRGSVSAMSGLHGDRR